MINIIQKSLKFSFSISPRISEDKLKTINYQSMEISSLGLTQKCLFVGLDGVPVSKLC